MGGKKQVYICIACKHEEAKWVGRCNNCEEWNSFEEKSEVRKKKTDGEVVDLYTVTDIPAEDRRRYQTGINEVDRIFGGGIVKGSLTLLGGSPGVGKTTLLTQISKNVGSKYPNENILYISGEESVAQVSDRFSRVKNTSNNIKILHHSSWQSIQEVLEEHRPELIMIDSIQTIYSNEASGTAGSVSQVKEITYELMNKVKQVGATCLLIGHVNKEGGLAGPKLLEHMVDSVVLFEGEKEEDLRILRSSKNRFGSTKEVGILEMCENGLKEVDNPNKYFQEGDLRNSVGKSVSCIVEGSRTLFTEVQALVGERSSGINKRITQGFDVNRLSMHIAIIEKYIGNTFEGNNVYLNILGAGKVKNPEIDLSIIACLISSMEKVPIDCKTIFLGEVGLTGEIRKVRGLKQRLKEIEQLGFCRIVLGEKDAAVLKKETHLEVVGIRSVEEIEKYLK